jgi:hypothetical protein
MSEDYDDGLRDACSRWTWDEWAVALIAFGAITAMLLGAI